MCVQLSQGTKMRLPDVLFVVPGNSWELLGMPDRELLGILKIMCDVIEDQQATGNSTPRQ